MELLEGLISKNLENYPELGEYKDIVLDFIASYERKRPDMCVEGCKSLIEGVSKFVSFNLSDEQNLSKWNNLKVKEKFEHCIELLKLDGYEDEFIRSNTALVFKLGQIRNERGDISHGQAYPKNSYSDPDFAKFITLWTEGLCYFILERYILSKQSEEDGAVYSNEQFEEFDYYLDNLYPDIKHVSYSKALKEQDALQYELLMDDYYKSQ